MTAYKPDVQCEPGAGSPSQSCVDLLGIMETSKQQLIFGPSDATGADVKLPKKLMSGRICSAGGSCRFDTNEEVAKPTNVANSWS